jgi:8-oxo-dGTP pyrophosphatase MutT (NUDIX family)
MPKSSEIEVIARGLIRHGQYLLACKNTAKGYYYLPGGHVEPGEAAAEAIAREIKEETGEIANVGPPLFACEVIFRDGKQNHHEFNVVFHVEMKKSRSGNVRPSIRSKEKGIAFEWIDQAAVVDVDLRPSAIRAWIASGCTTGSDPIGWASTRG